MTDNTVNIGKLFARIAKVSGELGKLKKDATHAQGYAYFSADSIMGHINSLMAENGLAVIPTVLDCTVVDGSDKIQRWLITYEFAIGDIDGNVFSSRWTGEAPMQGKKQDGTLYADDKSMGKAHTYAYKYWLQKLFMISTVDSDDLDTNVTDSASQKPAQSQQKQSNSQQKANQSKAQKPAQDKKSTNPDDHFGKKDFDMNLLKELTKPLYDNAKHQTNSINKLFTDGVLKADMNVDTAAAYVFRHRAGGKELGFDDNDIKEALGMTLGEFLKRNPRRYGLAWEHLLNHNAKLEEESEFPD